MGGINKLLGAIPAPDEWSEEAKAGVREAQKDFFELDDPSDLRTLDHRMAIEKAKRTEAITGICYALGIAIRPVDPDVRDALDAMTLEEMVEVILDLQRQVAMRADAMAIGSMPPQMRAVLKTMPIPTGDDEIDRMLTLLQSGEVDDIEYDGSGKIETDPVTGLLTLEAGKADMKLQQKQIGETPAPTTDDRIDKLTALRDAVQRRGGSGYQGTTSLNDLFSGGEDDESIN